MLRHITRPILVIALALTTTAVPHPTGQARAQDPCSEPNDQFQQACPLIAGTEAIGYISHTEDVDAYRIESLDFNVSTRLELTGMAAAYRIALVDWNGRQVATSVDQGERQVLEANLGPPGTYYVFIDSRFGEHSHDRAYRLAHRLAYPTGIIPRVAFSRDFASGDPQEGTTRYGDNELVISRGRLTLAKRGAGSVYASLEQLSSGGRGSIQLTDFTIVVDVRMDGAVTNAGYWLSFGHLAGRGSYWFTVRPTLQTFQLQRHNGPEFVNLAGPTRSDIIDPSGGVNRLVIRLVGEQVTANVNGQQVVSVNDQRSQPGSVGFHVTVDTKDLFTVHFDNILVTVPQ
jgi:hypothetical protein